MFSTLEEFKNNQLSSGHLGITKNNLEGYYNGLTQHLNTEDWGNLYHNFNHLTKLGVLKNEVLVRYYEGWFGLTNYRLYSNLDSGLISVPISSIVKYASYTTPDTEEFKKAKIFYENQGYSIDDQTVVFKTINGGYSQLGGGLLHEKYIESIINTGDYLDLNDEEKKSIYKSRNSLKKKYSEIENWDIDNLIEKLFKPKGLIKKSDGSVVEVKSIEGGILKFISDKITEKIDTKTDNYSQLIFSYNKLIDNEFDLAKIEFDNILKNNISDEFAQIGIDIIKMTSISIEDLEKNNDIINKYKGDFKDILSILNNHLLLNIGKECYETGISYAVQKRKQIQEANMKAAGAVLTATTASNFKSKTYRNIGYAASGGMLLSSGSSRSDASESEAIEVQYMQAGFNICSTVSSNLKSFKSKYSNEYIANFFSINVIQIININHELVKQELLENSQWGNSWNKSFRYKDKLKSKMILHTYNFYNLLDYLGFDDHPKFKEKHYFEKYFKLISELSDSLKKSDTLSTIIGVLTFIITLIVMIITLFEEGGILLILFEIIFGFVFAFVIKFSIVKHKKHDELKTLFMNTKKSIDSMNFKSSDIDVNKIGLG